MHDTISKGRQKLHDIVSKLEITSGVLFVALVSCVLSVVTNYLSISDHLLRLKADVFLSGHVNTLLTYSFYHEDVGHLVLSLLVFVLFCSGFENGVGTVRFLHQLLLTSLCVGLLHVLVELLLFTPSSRSSVSGLIPISLAVLGMVTVGSRMRKAFLMGINVPTASLPWILLLPLTLLNPNTVFLCNVLAIVTGEMFGLGWCSLLEMSESKACVLEKKIPFRLLKKVASVKFVPASAEERRKTLQTICNPPPGSYPVQAYAPASSSTPQGIESPPSTLDGWPHSAYMQQSYMVPSQFPGYNFGPRLEPSHAHGHAHGHGHGHECGNGHGHGHGHSHQYFANSSWMPAFPNVLSHLSPPMNMAVQPGNASQTTVQAALSDSANAATVGHAVPFS